MQASRYGLLWVSRGFSQLSGLFSAPSMQGDSEFFSVGPGGGVIHERHYL